MTDSLYRQLADKLSAEIESGRWQSFDRLPSIRQLAKTQKVSINTVIKALHLLADQTDASFRGAVAAQERKQIKGLEHLEKRMLKAQKKKLLKTQRKLQSQKFKQSKKRKKLRQLLKKLLRKW